MSTPKSKSPLSRRSETIPPSPLNILKSIRGHSSLVRFAAFAISRTAYDSPQPMETSPLISPALQVSSHSVFSQRWTISSARLRRRMPVSVSVTLRLPRTKSGLPISSSSFCIWRERFGCVVLTSSAAFVMFSSRATARKYFNSLSSIIRSIARKSMLVNYGFA